MNALTILDLSEARRALPVPGPLQAPAIEAASPTIFYGTGDDLGFRRISQPASIRDLTPPVQDRMQRVSYFLWVTNPLAQALVEIITDFVVGEGVRLKAEDPAVQQVIEEFWNDPANDLDANLDSSVTELSVFGEQVVVCPTNPINGQVRLGYIDPSNIDSVEWATLAILPGRAVTAVPSAVVLRPLAGESEKIRLEVVHVDEDPMSATFGLLVGNCFYWAINKARAASRGISALFAVADWIDGYDQMLWALMSQVDALSRFIWDVQLQGMTGEQIEAWLKDHGTVPRPNSIRAHNEKVIWQAVAPDIKAGDRSDAVRMVKNTILGNKRIPEHWFGTGDMTNRATAVEQGEPVLKMLTRRQRYERYRLRQILRYVIDRKIAAGVLPAKINRQVDVIAPELSVRDLQKAATALQVAAQGIVAAQQSNLMDDHTAAQILAGISSHLGATVDAEEMLARARADGTDRELRDHMLRPPPAELGTRNPELETRNSP